jgi:ABC-type multidrug transport system ATPase subunit
VGRLSTSDDLKARTQPSTVSIGSVLQTGSPGRWRGQQQRAAISRAVAPNPTVLLLDEPTSALDPERANEAVEVIRRLAAEDDLAMIISTHQLLSAVADRVVFLSGGSIVEEGPDRTSRYVQIRRMCRVRRDRARPMQSDFDGSWKTRFATSTTARPAAKVK